ncbi:MAG: hypothetical protein ACT4PL_04485 [Phycisphaerales bacterium]
MTLPGKESEPGASAGSQAGPEGGAPTVLMVCADLTWSTRIRSTADALAIATRPVRSLAMLEARLADTRVAAVIMELDAGAICLEVLGALRSGGHAARGVPVVAFAPHVNVAAMNDALARGATSVLARGAFSAQLPQILRALVAGERVASQVED